MLEYFEPSSNSSFKINSNDDDCFEMLRKPDYEIMNATKVSCGYQSKEKIYIELIYLKLYN